MAAKVLLSREPLATHGTWEGPLSCVATDVSLHDSLLLGSVRAEWALVEFHWHYQTITCRGRERPFGFTSKGQHCKMWSLTLLL